jgi:hypothetical protein
MPHPKITFQPRTSAFFIFQNISGDNPEFIIWYNSKAQLIQYLLTHKKRTESKLSVRYTFKPNVFIHAMPDCPLLPVQPLSQPLYK